MPGTSARLSAFSRDLVLLVCRQGSNAAAGCNSFVFVVGFQRMDGVLPQQAATGKWATASSSGLSPNQKGSGLGPGQG